MTGMQRSATTAGGRATIIPQTPDRGRAVRCSISGARWVGQSPDDADRR